MSGSVLVVDDSRTLRRVVASILQGAGYATRVAGGGREALAMLAEAPADLLLLDFVMPDMDGLQFCRALREQAALRDLPVVLMSAKADSLRQQFLKQSGAIDAISKPFDPRALVAVVEGALRPRALGSAPSSSIEFEEEGPESVRPSLVPESQSRAREALVGPAGDVVAEAIEALLDAGAPLPTTKRELRSLVGRALTLDRLMEVLSVAGVGAPLVETSLSGNLAAVSVGEVLQLLHMQRQSGSLEVRTAGGRRVTLFLSEGSVDLAASRGLGREFLLGRYLVEQGSLDRPTLAEVLGGDRGTALLGDVLVSLGLTTREERRAALERQTSELVYEIVRWTSGHFTFVAGATAPAAEAAHLQLSPNGLIMEGFRRVDEWRLIEGSFDFDDVLHCDDVALRHFAAESTLRENERAVLAAIDGKRTVRGIVERVEGSSFVTCKVLYQLLHARLVRREAA